MTNLDAAPVFQIYPATVLDDIEQLRPVFETTIRDPITREIFTDEVSENLEYAEQFRRGQGEMYFAVALAAGRQAVGVMALRPLAPSMRQFAETARPVELTTACVMDSQRGSGVGRALVSHLETVAKERGHSEIVLNSGPRYRATGWPFWRRLYGEPVAVAKDYYGPRFDAMVWRKILDNS